MLVAGQTSKTTNGNSLSQMFTIKYGEPKITYVALPNNARTAGGTTFYIYGENFGRKELIDVSVLVAGIDFLVLEHNHTFMVVETQPGQGTSLSIRVRVVDAISKPALEKFSYNAPLIHSLICNDYAINDTSLPLFPTTGKYMNGSVITVIVTGDNFGIPGSATVFFGTLGAFIRPDKPYLLEEHTKIEFLLPPGSGFGHKVTVEVYGQITVSTEAVVLNYSPPKVENVFFPNGRMTSGCGEYNKQILPGRNGLFCKERATFTLYGANFGRTPLVELLTEGGKTNRLQILRASHSEIQLVLPRGKSFHDTGYIIFEHT